MSAPPLRTVIADDEPLARDLLRALLGDLPDVELIGEATDGDSLVALVLQQRPDVAFIDVDMPGRDGLQASFDLAGRHPPEFVFVTAHADRAVEAFDLGAADYVLKPIRPHRLRQAVARVRRRLSPETGPAKDSLKPTSPSEIWVPTHSGGIKVPIAEIVAIEADKDYARLKTRTGQHLIRITMARLEELLKGSGLLRVHRSAFARLDLVCEVQRVSKGMILRMEDGGCVRVGRKYLDSLPAGFAQPAMLSTSGDATSGGAATP